MLTRTFALLAVLAVPSVSFAVPTIGPERVLAEGEAVQGFDIAANDFVYLAVWTDVSGSVPKVVGRIFRASDATAAGAPFEIAASAQGDAKAAVASDGRVFLVAWVHGPVDGSQVGDEVRVARITSDGAVLDPGGIVVDDADSFADGSPVRVRHSSVDVASNETQWLVSWRDPDTCATRLAADGVVLDPNPIRIGEVSDFRVAPHGRDFIAYFRVEDGGARVVVLRERSIGPSDWVPRPRVGTSRAGDVASDGTNVVSIQSIGEERVGIFVGSLDGATLDTVLYRQISVSTETSRASYRGDRYLVVWDEGQEIRASRMWPDLAFVDGAAGFPVMRGARLDRIVDLGDRALVVAVRDRAVVARTVVFGPVSARR